MEQDTHTDLNQFLQYWQQDVSNEELASTNDVLDDTNVIEANNPYKPIINAPRSNRSNRSNILEQCITDLDCDNVPISIFPPYFEQDEEGRFQEMLWNPKALHGLRKN